ncbi:MAG: DUF262 domain-containing protein, partial [Caldisericia bacterium]|nr:DUF262 domain-containing protein [Caldisericia bacterium]
MDVKRMQLTSTLGGLDQFVVPIYQRNYSWGDKQNKRLIEDIIKVGSNLERDVHFLGSIVYIRDDKPFIVSETQILRLIDGQQRLTTISILLYALSEIMTEKSQDIRYNYLLYERKKGDARYKLILSSKDKDTYTRIIEGEEDVVSNDSLVDNSYRYFKKILQSKNTKELDIIWTGILKLAVVHISLDKGDNPQLIFETLNSTGKGLTETDKIRNYLLMSLEASNQDIIYRNKWLPIERIFNGADKDDRFDRFVRDYLTMKYANGRLPNLGDVYDEFKVYATDGNQSVEELASDLLKYAKYYSNIHLGTEKNPKLRKAFKDLRSIRVEVSYPFLLKIYDDFANQTIDSATFLKIIQTIETYTFRRQICDLPTRGQNKIFANMSSEVDEENYLESVVSHFLVRKNEYRFPSDDEFVQMFETKDIYHMRPRSYVLEKLENSSHSKEPVNANQFTIEHILPQNKNLSKTWRETLGQKFKSIQEIYLHRIGNLTLTGYNPEMSDKSFEEKKTVEGGFNSSPLTLNRYISKFDKWDENAIIKRTKYISTQALKIWGKPIFAEHILSKYVKEDSYNNSDNGYDLSIHFEEKDENIQVLFNQFLELLLSINKQFEKTIYKRHLDFDLNGEWFCWIRIYQKQITVYFYDSWVNYDQLKKEDPADWITAKQNDENEWYRVKFALVPDD